MSRVAVKKAFKDFNRYAGKQIIIIFPAAAVVLWQQFGYRKERIISRFAEAQKAWEQCAEYGAKKSMIQMMEEETGVELWCSGLPSYHTISYLDINSWNGKTLSPEQEVYMRQQQKKWMAPQLLASICIALHKNDGFGVGPDGKGRLQRFISEVDKLRKQLGENPKKYAKKLCEETNIDPKLVMPVGY